MSRINLAVISMISFLGLGGAATAQPLSTAFTYQGELRSAGAPASGAYDLRFRLYDAASGGAQVGPILCSDNLGLTNGRFTVDLDFGSQFSGQQRFLEIDVRADTGLGCANGAGFITLAPRQPLTGAPNALFALNATTASTAASATNATQLNGQPAAFYQNAGNLTSGTIPSARLSGTYSGLGECARKAAAVGFADGPAGCRGLVLGRYEPVPVRERESGPRKRSDRPIRFLHHRHPRRSHDDGGHRAGLGQQHRGRRDVDARRYRRVL